MHNYVFMSIFYIDKIYYNINIHYMLFIVY